MDGLACSDVEVFVVVGRMELVVFVLTNARIAVVENINIVSRRSSPWFRCIEDLSREYQWVCGVYFWWWEFVWKAYCK